MKNKVFYFVLIFSFLFCGYLLYFATSEGKQCLENPYVYGAKKMGNIECSCYQDRGMCNPEFNFNDTSFTAIPVKCGSDNNMNLSEQNISLDNLFIYKE